jgi:hypothetical protein
MVPRAKASVDRMIRALSDLAQGNRLEGEPP